MNPTPPPQPPPPGVPTAPRRRGIPRSLIERVVLISVILGSFWSIYWSINRLRLLQAQSRGLNQKVAKLTADIDLMKSRWTDARARSVLERHASLPETLFPGAAAVSAWLDDLQKSAVPLALDTQVRLGEVITLTNSLGTVSRVRVSVDLRPASTTPAASPLYHRMLQWTRLVTGQARRVDLLGFSVLGANATGGTATAALELWTRETPPSIEPPTAGPDSPATANHLPGKEDSISRLQTASVSTDTSMSEGRP